MVTRGRLQLLRERVRLHNQMESLVEVSGRRILGALA